MPAQDEVRRYVYVENRAPLQVPSKYVHAVAPGVRAGEHDHRRREKPERRERPREEAPEEEQTFFVVDADAGLTDRRPYCKNVSGVTAKQLRPGFLLSFNATIYNINFQGADTRRGSDNGDLCGGGVFETPGCVRGEGRQAPVVEQHDGKDQLPIYELRVDGSRQVHGVGLEMAGHGLQSADQGFPPAVCALGKFQGRRYADLFVWGQLLEVLQGKLLIY